MGFLTKLQAEWPVIAQAPWNFALAVAIVTAVVWIVMQWRYRETIAKLKERIEARDDRIKSLESTGDGGSVAMELAALKKSIAGRRLTDDQRFKLRNALRGKGGRAEVTYNASGSDCQRYAHDFRDVFKEAGWDTTCNAVLSGAMNAGLGLAIATQNLATFTPGTEAMARALAEAGLHYDVDHMEVPPNLDVRLIISVRAL